MHGRLARPAVRPRRAIDPRLCPRFCAGFNDGTNGPDECCAMTAPLKHSHPITVDVALGERAYDIVIGRDVLPSLGARVAALRPGEGTALVTDGNGGKHRVA